MSIGCENIVRNWEKREESAKYNNFEIFREILDDIGGFWPGLVKSAYLLISFIFGHKVPETMCLNT